MRTLLLTTAAALLWPLGALAQAGNAPAAPAEPAKAEEGAQAETRQLAPLQAREVIERLKTMRAQLLLEQEYNRLLEARVERQELETKLGKVAPKAAAAEKAEKSERPDRVHMEARPLPPPPKLESATEQLSVKAVTVAPFKEAIVTYRGRVYTVRPGDRLGDIEIRDINDSGVITSGSSGRAAVMLGQ